MAYFQVEDLLGDLVLSNGDVNILIHFQLFIDEP